MLVICCLLLRLEENDWAFTPAFSELQQVKDPERCFAYVWMFAKEISFEINSGSICGSEKSHVTPVGGTSLRVCELHNTIAIW